MPGLPALNQNPDWAIAMPIVGLTEEDILFL